jgi:hypothetical protein
MGAELARASIPGPARPDLSLTAATLAEGYSGIRIAAADA